VEPGSAELKLLNKGKLFDIGKMGFDHFRADNQTKK